MTSVSSSPLRIAIVDDDPELAETTGWDLEDAGYEPWLLVNGSYTDVNQLASQIAANAQGAVCDNRLSYSGLANFYGAQLVAALYQRQIPSLLITQYADIDAPLSIRKFRKQIPILLSRDKVDGAIIRQGIEKCRREFRG